MGRLVSLSIEILWGHPHEPTRRRPPAGHARRARAQDPELGPDARLRRRPLAPTGHRRRPPDRGRFALPRAASARATRLGRERMGALGEQPASQVLPHHHRRPPATPRRIVHVDDILGRRVQGARHDDRGRMSSPSWRRYLRSWGSDPGADVDDELAFHIESRVQEYIAMGLTPEAARAEAVRRFGNVAAVQQSCRQIDRLAEQERKRGDMWEALEQDLRYAARALRRSPGFTIIAVLTLALGIGANTAIFSVVNGVLLRPLPYPAPDRLVRVYTAFRGSGTLRYSMSQPEFMDYKSLTHVFENAAAYTGAPLTLTGACGSSSACE